MLVGGVVVEAKVGGFRGEKGEVVGFGVGLP